jgi:DNA-binding CsgD family transcriptional regulator
MDMVAGSGRESGGARRQWTAEEKLLTLGRASTLSGPELDAFLQRNRLSANRLESWRETAIRALALADHEDEQAAATAAFRRRLPLLTKREHEVLSRVVTDMANKQIAAELGIALDTVKVHRGRAMAKLQVRSLVMLVQLWERAAPDAAPDASLD